MPYRPLVQYSTPAEYREHFSRRYCNFRLQVLTSDLIAVTFWPTDFDHAFYKGPAKARFAIDRAVRIDWIGEALFDPQAELYLGWDKYRRRYTPRRRVCLVDENYVVVIELFGSMQGRFVTAFIADPWIVPRIRNSTPWPQ